MKKTVLTMLITSLTGTCMAQEFQWVNTTGNLSDDFGKAVTIDAAGNSYAVGYGRVNYIPPTTIYGASIAKYTTSGTEAWLKTIYQSSGMNSIVAHDVAVDAAGNVYAVGSFYGTIDFDPGAGVSELTTSSTLDDGYIVKLNASGDFQWVKAIQSPPFVSIKKIKINGEGDLLIGGEFQGIVDFDPSAASTQLTSIGMNDVFYAKFNADGDFQWVKQIGGQYTESIIGLEFDANDNIYVAGNFVVETDFNIGGTAQSLTTVGTNSDAYLLKTNSDGDFVWVKQVEASEYVSNLITSLSVADQIIMAGYFAETIDFDPGAGVSELTANGDFDGYILKLTLDGNFVWVKQLVAGTNGTVTITGVSQNTSGKVVLTGDLFGSADFNPGTGVANLSAGLDNTDLFVLQLTANGDYEWAVKMGGSGQYQHQKSADVVVDNNNTIWTVGAFIGTVDFNPGNGVSNQTPIGAYDAYLLKLSAPVVNPPTSVEQIEVSSPMTVYPNPANDLLNIVSNSMGTITIYSMEGRIMAQSVHTMFSTISITDYPSGVYLIQVANNEGNMCQTKFIKE
jgi:hypothetical protein